MTGAPPPTGPDDTPAARADEPGARDPQVASWLAVEPLDDVTRVRLVRAAMTGAAAPPAEGTTPAAGEGVARRGRHPLVAVAAVAAAVVAALLVAGALLLPGDDDTAPTALDRPATTAAPEASRDAGDATALAPAETGAAVPEAALPALPDLGDLGDVSTEARLEAAARARLTLGLGEPTAVVTGCAADAGRAFGTPIAAGGGRIDGRRATVLVAAQPAGSTAVVAVRGERCGRAVSVILPAGP